MSLTDHINAALRRVPPWTIYVLATIYAVWLFYLGATGGLGVEPVEALEHLYGELALQLLILGLLVTPLRKHLGINLMKHRRAIGVVAFFFVLAHFLVWAILDVQSVARIWDDVLDRPYITIGMTGFLLLIPLAVTSNDFSVRKLGAQAWRRLHKLVYFAALLGGLHYVWLAKGFQLEPLIYFFVIGILVVQRYYPTGGGRRRSA